MSAVHPFPHLTATEAGLIETAMERMALELAHDPERAAVCRALETAAAECRLGAERADAGETLGLNSMDASPAEVTRWIKNLADRGAIVTPSGPQLVGLVVDGRIVHNVTIHETAVDLRLYDYAGEPMKVPTGTVTDLVVDVDRRRVLVPIGATSVREGNTIAFDRGATVEL